DMLFFINQKGPLTEGIFRILASVRACGALKEKLSSGEKVNFDNESLLVVATVLKDFFRNLQESLFLSDLYCQWLAVIDQGSEEEKITAIQSISGLVDQLPMPSVVLLWYLFGVLHNIEQHSASNQMTAYNLSVCIAPSILWSFTSCSPGLENKSTKKISLVQFLIENCFKILGEDILSLLEESSTITTSCDDSEKASGTVKDLMAFSNYKQEETVLKSCQVTSQEPCPQGEEALKQEQIAPVGSVTSAGQKTGERKWPTINCQDNECTALPSPKPGKLFGVPLKDLCDKDDLPAPLRDRTSIIEKKGKEESRGWRLTINVKACGALTEKLNFGEKVKLDEESVFVVASVLKKGLFFRNIQESIFSSDLCDKWLAVIDQGSEEEKITAIQSVTLKINISNFCEFEHILSVKHNTEQHSASSQMTAYNLSVCIAPSILWSSTSRSPGLESELTGKHSRLWEDG
uniref:Rho-GAP domain-containing protein n=1 Tax=Loxodonta africana TaxID=9785 RepID=G3UFQ2_LOXAF